MDLTIKVKPHELEAIDFLNKRSMEIYSGKKHGFYSAVHEAALNIDNINWRSISTLKLEDMFGGKGFEDKATQITHLSVDENDYNIVFKSMNIAFESERGVYKSVFIRNVLKWATSRVLFDIEEINAQKLKKNELKKEDFSILSSDEKLELIYNELLIIKGILMRK